MLGSYFSPLAPAAVLLLSAFILPIVIPVLPSRWRAHPGIRYFGAPGLVGLAMLTLLGIRLTSGADISGQSSELLSGWRFSTSGPMAALMARADSLSLIFLIITLLTLLAATLLRADPAATETVPILATGWLTIGAGACLLFASANSLTLIFGMMVFDTFIALYWLGRGQYDWGVARLFLGMVTASSLMVAALEPVDGLVSAIGLPGLVLWLRLGLYPLLEAMAQRRWSQDERLVYQALSLAAALYLIIRVVNEPLPIAIRWLAGLTMTLTGLLAWLTGSPPTTAGGETGRPVEWTNGTRTWLLTWLGVTEALLILAAGPLPAEITAAFAIGLILSLVALWVTPALGRPHLQEGAWSWPYLPAVAATLTLIGLPLSLNWLAKAAIYPSLFASSQELFTSIVILAELLAFSGLVRYWLILWQGSEINSRRSVVGIVVMVPFLIPGFGPFILSTLTETGLAVMPVEPPAGILGVFAILIIGGALGLGYFRSQLMRRLKIPVDMAIELVHLNGLLDWWRSRLGGLGRFILRVRVVLEGQHYIGWAIFIALVGALIILLGG